MKIGDIERKMSKLTPLPWKILPTVATGKIIIGALNGLVTEEIAQMLQPKPHATVALNCELMENHAMMIVHAVNNYERLSKDNARLLAALEQVADPRPDMSVTELVSKRRRIAEEALGR